VLAGNQNIQNSLVLSEDLFNATPAEKTINWLAARNFHDLLRRSALVLNDVHRSQTKEYEAKVREHFESRVGAIKTVPWDKHLRDDAVLDFDGLDRDTQLAYIDLAAWLAQGFPAARAGVR
jgi:MinD-like ATPase involved in chromosome partitioning or flagellar assembly